jgi:hypothetical protein
MINLTGTTGGGTQFAGIKHFRKRLLSGADQDVDFGEWPNCPDVILKESAVSFLTRRRSAPLWLRMR